MSANTFEGPILLQDAAAATANGATVMVHQYGTVGVQITGTFVGTVSFEGSNDGATWVALQAKPSDSVTLVTSATAPGLWMVLVAGVGQFRARISAFTSGAITAKAIAQSEPIGLI